MTNQQTTGFHAIKVTGDLYGNAVTVTQFENGEVLRTVTPRSGRHFRFQDITVDPWSMGDRPHKTDEGTCSVCGIRWVTDLGLHPDQSGEHIPAVEFHRYPAGSREPGFYSDECEENQR